jgi:hypothetical protein
MKNKDEEIEKLIDKASKSNDSNDALKFSQAACNAANAVMCMINAKIAEANIPIAK